MKLNVIVCGCQTINNNFLVKMRVKSLNSNECSARCVQTKSRATQMLSHSHCKTHFVIIAIEIDFSYEKRNPYVHLQLVLLLNGNLLESSLAP